MRILALDAALGPCSVAVMEDGVCLGSRSGGDSRSATSSLPGLVQGLMADHPAMFDAVAVTVGPGSFTGLRGALALGNGLALGAGVPLVGVTVAEALLAARPAGSGRTAWVALDSRRSGRVFLGRDAGMEAVSLAALPMPSQPVIVFGDAADAVVEALCRAGRDAVSTRVGSIDIVAVGQVGLRRLVGELSPCPPQPLYVEQPEARVGAGLRPAPA